MKKKPDRRAGKPAAVILEEAVHQLRSRPLVLAPYYIGSLPFMLGMLYFWTDMATGATSWRHLPQFAWVMALLFIWMKAWQSVFASSVAAGIAGEPPPAWNVRRIVRMIAVQTAIQPWGIVALPLSLVVMLPFPQTVAFFQNVTVLGSGLEGRMTRLLGKAWRHASTWPFQNSLVIWLTSPALTLFVVLFLYGTLSLVVSMTDLQTAADLEGMLLASLLLIAALSAVPLCPLGIIVALNIGAALQIVPWLLRSLFGVETAFSMSASQVATSSIFFALVSGLTYLLLDPLFKTSYCLRCFYTDALSTGEDLRTELRALLPAGRGAAAILFAGALVFVSFTGAFAAVPRGSAPTRSRAVLSAEQLDAAIERAVNRPEYTWRMPRERPPAVEGQGGLIRTFLQSATAMLKKVWSSVSGTLFKIARWIYDLIFRLLPEPRQARPAGTRMKAPYLIIVAVLAVFGAVALFLWLRSRRGRRAGATVSAAPAIEPAPDIRGDDVDAAALPEDGWLSMARELIDKGELRLALRALYLATLAFLASRNLIVLEKSKSDREYEAELGRHSPAYPALLAAFREGRSLFEGAWYGAHRVTMDVIEDFYGIQGRVREDG
jgi:hypothetical protein